MVLREPFSGVEYAVSEQAQALAEVLTEDLQVSVLWPRHLGGIVSPALQDGPATLLPSGFNSSSRALRILWEQLFLPHILHRLRADILHAPAYLAPLAAPCPTVLGVYDLHALDNPGHCRFLNRWNFRIFLPPAIRRAARIIVPSDATYKAISRRFPSVANKVRLVPPGIPARFRPDPEPCPEAAKIVATFATGRYLLCVGNLEPRKNIPLAVEALALLRKEGADLGLLVAGHKTIGDPLLEETIRQHGLQKVVRLHGYVPESSLPTLYANAAALVYPAQDEGYGLPPLEAMACGCPVICIEGGTAHQDSKLAAISFSRPDAHALAETIRNLITSPAELARIRNLAVREAAARRWPAVARRVLEVYREVFE